MEIPYIVTPRRDTGLYNAKIAIWLFLASEVMLFGGFFSAYVFLRVGADYPWPERALPVLPGLINTFVLIGSSMTVVFAWAALKMRQYRMFQVYMSITLLCAALFMVFKGMEYNVKFHHQGVRLSDYSIVEGHLDYIKKSGAAVEEEDHGNHNYLLDRHGKTIESNRIFVNAEGVSFSTLRFHAEWVEEILSQAKANGSKITLAEPIKGVTADRDGLYTLYEAGTPLSLDLLEELQEIHIAARTHNQEYRTAALRFEFANAAKENPEVKRRNLAALVSINEEALSPKLLTEFSSATFKIDPSAVLRFSPRDIKDDELKLRDDTRLTGSVEASPLVLHAVDAVDFQHLVMKARERKVDPDLAIRESWLMKNWDFLPAIWEKHLKAVGLLEASLKQHDRVPNDIDRYRIKWQQMVYYIKTDLKDISLGDKPYSMPTASTKITEEFVGPDYQDTDNRPFAELSIPREQVGFSSKFTPSWNTYYATYFTITGLHGLHVIGGALVLGYYLFFGRKMYLSNPEWLANRVEVGGLFWHFVDLVWIFVFPIMYLM